MYNRPELEDRDLARLIPHVMGTQHPDNVSTVPFGDSARVGRDLEGEEVLYNVTSLGLREIMIDYERKHGECTPLWEWLHRCPTCLEEKVIGRDFHVTPRLPNPDTDRDDPYYWQSLGIFSQSVLVMHRMGYAGPAFTEFIIPDSKQGHTLARIERDICERYGLLRRQYREHGDRTEIAWDGEFFVQGIPLIETVEDLLAPDRIWDEMISARKELTGRPTHIQRSFIARSDPALKAGLVPALLASTVALHKGREYEARTGVRVPQIVGIGSAPFRGGLTPEEDSVGATVATYPGAMTLTAQSAFRYDHPAEQVLGAAAELDKRLLRGWLDRNRTGDPIPDADVDRVREIVSVLKAAYEDSFRELLPRISRVAKDVPSHRERYADVGVAGEVRRVGGMPAVRAIRFAAACYTLGVPPGALGFRAWEDLRPAQRDLVEQVVPTLRHWLTAELRWANPDNLERFPESASVRKDLGAVLGWLDHPQTHAEHARITGGVAGRLDGEQDLGEQILQAARLRGFLG